MAARLRSAARRAGLGALPRLIHGARHHAGTDFLRSSKNLKLTQRLLGHKDIQSTMRYAHALDDDLIAALEARDAAAEAPPPAAEGAARKDRKGRVK
jgi:integrase